MDRVAYAFYNKLRWTLLTVAAAGLVIYAACETVSTPTQVAGPKPIGDRPPTITITSPIQSFSIGQGETFDINWMDQDPDSRAVISFSLIATSAEASPQEILLVEGIPESDTEASDNITVSTGFVPRGTYYLQAVIDDRRNPPITAFATTETPAASRVVVTVGEAGAAGGGNRPPTIYVTQPNINLSVTLDDVIDMVVQPSSADPNTNIPYDPDSDAELYLSLDLDDDPETGDPLATVPDPSQLILLRGPTPIPQGTWAALPAIPITVDLDRFPPREDGKPYFLRATISDGINAPRDAYATGTINVTRAATGRADLGKVGGTLTGVTWQGFDPGARLGNAMSTVGNFDAGAGATEADPLGDAVDDCLLVAQFGTPTGLGPIGEAYLIYGMNGLRFGGRINVNTVGAYPYGVGVPGSPSVEGATFLGPRPVEGGETDGITSVGYIPDLSGDRRPELLFGCTYVDGVRQHRDDDPGDSQAGDRQELVARIQQGNLKVHPVKSDGSVDLDESKVVYSNPAYNGAVDTTLDLDEPDLVAGTADTLTWDGKEVNNEFTASKWVVIQFKNLESELDAYGYWVYTETDTQFISATLSVWVTRPGDDSEVHALLWPQIDQNTTLQTFSDGGAPVEDVNYKKDAVTGGGFQEVSGGWNNLDVTDTIQDIFDQKQYYVGWVIIPTGIRPVDFESSEGSENFRPRLEIRYSRKIDEGSSLKGCYNDGLPNDMSNSPELQGQEDDVIATYDPEHQEYLGFVALIHSENSSVVGPRGLNYAIVPIDMAGQRETQDDGTAPLIPGRGDAAGPSDRLEGARFQPAIYDVVDASHLNQGPIRVDFGARVGFLPDINNDGRPEVIISAPRNELDIQELLAAHPGKEGLLTHINSRLTRSAEREGNVIIFHGQNFNALREKSPGSSSIPYFSQREPGTCSESPPKPRRMEDTEYNWLVIQGEKPSDRLGDGSSAGDFNLDGSPDVLCGAPSADGPSGEDVGTTYIVYMRLYNEKVEIKLSDANDPSSRPPMLRIRGDKPGDRIGWVQESALDVNGDRINDILLSSPYADAGGVPPRPCSRDYNENGSQDGADEAGFSSCRAQFGEADLSSDHRCAFFDYNNDRRLDDLDAEVFEGAACPVDNGVVAVVFGGIPLDGDRAVAQIATPDLPGVVFHGASAGDRAGHDIASAGDFNKDGFGDILITAPGATALAEDGTTRVGVVYLIFGGPHLNNRRFRLADVGSADLPGIVFLSPFEAGVPNEAPPQYVAGLGDLNNDGFADIGIGNPLADFVDTTFPQEPGSPGSDLSTGRRRDAGEIYMIYGHNITASLP